MSRMWGIIAIFIAVVIFWIYFKKLQNTSTSSSVQEYSLASKPQVAPSSTTKLLLDATNTGTIQAFVYPFQAQKSGTVALCNPSGSENPGEPECSTGQYNMCKCVGNDCSKCTHSGYVNIMNISNVIRLEILASPDAGRPNAATAQLVVRTTGMATPILGGCAIKSQEIPFTNASEKNFFGAVKLCCNSPLVNGSCEQGNRGDFSHLCRVGEISDTADSRTKAEVAYLNSNIKVCEQPDLPKVQSVFEETIPLPNIPFQKWTFIALAREGRRFDVYYNGSIVASKRTQNVIDTKAAFSAITAGDPNLIGKIAFVESFPQKLSQPEIMANYKAKSDTTGQPIISAPVNIFDYMPNCKDGGCITGPKMRPTSPLLDWDTQYA